MKIILYVKFSREIFTLLPQKHYNLKKSHYSYTNNSQLLPLLNHLQNPFNFKSKEVYIIKNRYKLTSVFVLSHFTKI